MKHFWVKEKSRSCRPYKRQHGDVQEPQDHHSQQPTTLQHIAFLQKCDLWWQQLSSPKLSSDSNCASVHFFEHLSIVILPRILPCSKRAFAPEDAVERVEIEWWPFTGTCWNMPILFNVCLHHVCIMCCFKIFTIFYNVQELLRDCLPPLVVHDSMMVHDGLTAAASSNRPSPSLVSTAS